MSWCRVPLLISCSLKLSFVQLSNSALQSQFNLSPFIRGARVLSTRVLVLMRSLRVFHSTATRTCAQIASLHGCLLFVFNSPILEPNLHLFFGQMQVVCNFDASQPRQVFVCRELSFQLKQLSTRECCAHAFRATGTDVVVYFRWQLEIWSITTCRRRIILSEY